MNRKILTAACVLLLAPAAAAAEPLELFNNRLFLPATVNGERTVALLDSGAEMTVLDDDFARRLGLATEGNAVGRGTGAQTVEATFAEHLRVEAAGVSLEQRAAVIDLGEVSQRLVGRNVELILGREIFDNARLRIDIDGGTIDTRAEPGEGAVRLPVTTRRGIPTVPVSVEGHGPVQADFDLGNGSGVIVGRAYAERIGLTAPERIVGRRSGGGIGGPVERDQVILRSLIVAGREFRDVPAGIDANEGAADLNIGTSVLRHFVITADFGQDAVWLEQRP